MPKRVITRARLLGWIKDGQLREIFVQCYGQRYNHNTIVAHVGEFYHTSLIGNNGITRWLNEGFIQMAAGFDRQRDLRYVMTPAKEK